MIANNSQPEPTISLDRSPPVYAPGDRLEATVELDAEAGSAREAELSIVWHTAGKGDEDLHVFEFTRTLFPPRQGAAEPLSIAIRLPASPLSYDGVIVKVCWCVRARLFFRGGRQTLLETPFQLGSVDFPAAPASSDDSAPSTAEPAP